jgi:hypothetical protein
MGMPKDQKRPGRVAVAGAIIVMGASAITQTNGGLISSACADELPKERATIPASVQKPTKPAQTAVQQPKEKSKKSSGGPYTTTTPK